MQMQIELIAHEEDTTPEQAEKTQGYAEGFAESVKATQEKAQGNWGWCTVEVKVTINNITHSSYLGQCSWLKAEDFVQNSGYFGDMLEEVLQKFKDPALTY